MPPESRKPSSASTSAETGKLFGPLRPQGPPPPAAQKVPPAAVKPAPAAAVEPTPWRKVGWGLVVAGILVGAGGGGAFALLGKSQNDKVKAGGFRTAQDLLDVQDSAALDNKLCAVFGIAGAALVATGVPMILLHPAPAGGVAVAVRFP